MIIEVNDTGVNINTSQLVAELREALGAQVIINAISRMDNGLLSIAGTVISTFLLLPTSPSSSFWFLSDLLRHIVSARLSSHRRSEDAISGSTGCPVILFLILAMAAAISFA